MSVENQIQYHAQRAMRELDQGLAATPAAAAQAHMKLSSLHLERMRDLQARLSEPQPTVFG
jgi:hypothetical protein